SYHLSLNCIIAVFGRVIFNPLVTEAIVSSSAILITLFKTGTILYSMYVIGLSSVLCKDMLRILIASSIYEDSSLIVGKKRNMTAIGIVIRSEEHTSELQSRFDLVCRLLLEKKK